MDNSCKNFRNNGQVGQGFCKLRPRSIFNISSFGSEDPGLWSQTSLTCRGRVARAEAGLCVLQNERVVSLGPKDWCMSFRSIWGFNYVGFYGIWFVFIYTLGVKNHCLNSLWGKTIYIDQRPTAHFRYLLTKAQISSSMATNERHIDHIQHEWSI